MARKEKRFVTVFHQTSLGEGYLIVADKETGAHYLVTNTGYGGGVTPLLGKDGQPYVAAVTEELK